MKVRATSALGLMLVVDIEAEVAGVRSGNVSQAYAWGRVGVVYLDIIRDDVPGGIIELTLKGVLDANTFEKLDTVISDLLESGETNRLVVGMGGVTGLSSAGAGALLSITEQARNAGGGVVIYGVSASVLKTLTILGLVNDSDGVQRHRLTVVDGRAQALAFLGMKGNAAYYKSDVKA
jgi:anti-anti-sigma factor